jgi:FkbM family methyltransferase
LTWWARRLANANYEREMELLSVLCDRKKLGIDVGAKVGMYTYRIAARSARAIAFEPIPLFNRMLRKALPARRVQIEPVALSSTTGRTVLRMPVDHKGGHLAYGRSTLEPTNPLANEVIARVDELEVETRRLDDYALADVGFIKVDVEGHELSVLDGAAQTIAAQRPNLLIECNDEHAPNAVARLASWFAAHDYDALFMRGHELLPIDAYDRDRDWAHHIENFIGISRSRTELRERLASRVRAPRRLGAFLAWYNEVTP